MNRKTVFYWIAGIVVLAVIVVAAFWLDEPVRQLFVQHRNRALYRAMQSVSRFGDWPEHLVLGLVLLAIAWWRGSKVWIRIFLAMLVALALAGITARVIKIATGRPRPSVKTEQAVSRFSSKYQAFPSGHVAASTGFFGVLLFRRRRIGLPCMAIPVLIAFSRMCVAAHYLSDVVCAAILGLLCAAIVSWFVFKPNIGHRTSNI